MYRIESFDGLELSPYVDERQSHDMGGGNARGSFTRVPLFGYSDNYGSRKATRGQQAIIYQGELFSDTNSQTELVQQLDALRAKIGVRGLLFVRQMDGSRRYVHARLESVRNVSQVGQGLYTPVELRFTTVDQAWKADTQRNLTRNLDFADDFITWDIANYGGMDTLGVTITITAGTSQITRAKVTNTAGGYPDTFGRHRWSVDYTGTINAGQQLVIDSGIYKVTNNGANAYGAQFIPSYKLDWFGMKTQDINTIEVTLEGNSSQDAQIRLQWVYWYG